MKLPSFLQAEIDACPLPVEFRPGRKAIQLRVGGRLVGNLQRGVTSQNDLRVFKNLRRQLRAVIKELTT